MFVSRSTGSTVQNQVRLEIYLSFCPILLTLCRMQKITRQCSAVQRGAEVIMILLFQMEYVCRGEDNGQVSGCREVTEVSVTAMCRFDVRYCKYLFLILAADYLLTLIYFISLYLRGNFLLKTKDVNYVDPLHWMERDAVEPHQ